MFFLNISWLVFVAAVAGVLGIAVGMAHLAVGQALVPVVKRESMVDHPGWRPARGGVTVLTRHAKVSGMNFWFLVAAHAFGWDTAEDLVHVAGFAGYSFMPSIQDEKSVMLEITHPVNSIMAGQAVLPELSLVPLYEDGCRPLMAAHTKSQIETDLEAVLPCVAVCT